MPLSQSPILRLKGLTVSYSGAPLFSNLSAELHTGNVLGVGGRSGCGKTSLLRAVLGFIPAVAGEVEVCGIPLQPHTVAALRRCTAYLPQDVFLESGTAADWLNLTLALNLRCAKEDVLLQRAHDFALRLGLTPEQVHTTEAHTLSGGQRQRLLLAAALASPAPLLLLDEPTSALDAAHAEQAAMVIHQTCTDEGRAALIVSHSAELFRHCPTVMEL